MNAVPSRFYLEDHLFENFANQYKHIEAKNALDYSVAGQNSLGHERYAELIKIAGRQRFESVCEIGPGSGSVLKQFASSSNEIIGVDIKNSIYESDPKLKMILSGVHNMSQLPNNSVDFLYSYDAFEHIPEIEKGFDECFRVLKPGSLMYIKVGPTFLSPWGYHYYHILRAPYIHVLFSEEVLLKYAKLKTIEVPYINKVVATDYINYLKKLPPNCKVLSLKYDFDWYNTDMITKYAEVFKAKQVSFFDFFINSFSILIQKTS